MAAKVVMSRLLEAVRRARLELRPYRTMRRQLVRLYAGHSYAEGSGERKVMVNLLAQYVSVVGRELIAKSPRVLLSTMQEQARPAVRAMQRWVNDELGRRRVDAVLRRVVMDALFCVGVCKVCLANVGESMTSNWEELSGRPMASVVDLDDWVFDITATDLREASFMGHRYRIPRDAAIAMLGSKARKLPVEQDTPYNEQGDERLKFLGRTHHGPSEELEDMVALWEIYLPRQRRVWTLAHEAFDGPADSAGLLLDQPWIGPSSGPYVVLGLIPVPNNPMPKSPLGDLASLHEAANQAYRKVWRMIERTKENLLFSGPSTEDAVRITEASDGEAIRVDRPDSARQVVFGGSAAQLVLAIATVWKDLFDFMGGNLSLLGGLGPQSRTASQDRLLFENSARTIADMQMRVADFVTDVVRNLCWYYWNDPFSTYHSLYQVPTLPELSITQPVAPSLRANLPFDMLDIRIDPYSLRYHTPESRLSTINAIMKEVVLPLLPMLSGQGVNVDLVAYLRRMAELLDLPDLPEIVSIGEPIAQSPPSREYTPPAPSERFYVRSNVSAQTTQSANRNLVASLLGINTGGASSNGVQNVERAGQ